MVLRLCREVHDPISILDSKFFVWIVFLFYRIQTNRISRSDECKAFVLKRLRFNILTFLSHLDGIVIAEIE